jgi:hypothetical protein
MLAAVDASAAVLAVDSYQYTVDPDNNNELSTDNGMLLTVASQIASVVFTTGDWVALIFNWKFVPGPIQLSVHQRYYFTVSVC